MVSFKPTARLSVDLIYNYSNKGPDYPDDRNAIDPVTGLDVIFTYPFQKTYLGKPHMLSRLNMTF
ncbi:MAG: hypothetical protein IPI23_07720 [Bacteroidetes bacterium]|nr:hypothetical protein [Bacteroidota bacterium]